MREDKAREVISALEKRRYDTFEKLYDAALSPSDKILTDALRIPREERPVFPPYDEGRFWNEWLYGALSPIEIGILTDLYVGVGKSYDDLHPSESTISEVAKYRCVKPGVIFRTVRKSFETLTKAGYHLKLFGIGEGPDNHKEIRRIKSEIYDEAEKLRLERHRITALEKRLSRLRDESGEISEIRKSISEIRERLTELCVKEPPLEGLEIPIEELDLTVRAFNVLKRAKINDIGDILELKTIAALAQIKNMGRKNILEITKKLVEIDPELMLDPDGYEYELPEEYEKRRVKTDG